jgi:hypothetical protein
MTTHKCNDFTVFSALENCRLRTAQRCFLPRIGVRIAGTPARLRTVEKEKKQRPPAGIVHPSYAS